MLLKRKKDESEITDYKYNRLKINGFYPIFVCFNKMLFLRYFSLWGLVLVLCNCQAQTPQKKSTFAPIKDTVPSSTPIKSLSAGMNTIEISGHLIDIHTPAGTIKGNILILPGWDFPKDDWCKKSSLCQKALAKGYRLIMPEMGKSVYSAQFYPETRPDWLKFPNKEWVIKQMIPQLQSQYNILAVNQKNYVLGLSTGGRGVALICLALPDLFKAAASLSGDFEQTQMPADRLMIGYYGTLQQFPARWKGEDNPVMQAQHFKTPIYLGHGKQDNIVPYQQTILFYEALKKHHPELAIQLHLTEDKHDYAYWDSEVENMLVFLERF